VVAARAMSDAAMIWRDVVAAGRRISLVDEKPDAARDGSCCRTLKGLENSGLTIGEVAPSTSVARSRVPGRNAVPGRCPIGVEKA
jgi:hypothetical protein